MDLELLRTITEGHEAMALATIISVTGSSPRHVGSKMLVGATTAQLGTVGGGKGEAKALQACLRSLEDPFPSLLKVEMIGSAIIGPDMVCGGSNVMLIEPLDDREPYRKALALLSKGQRVLFVKRVVDPGSGPISLAVSLVNQEGIQVHGTLDRAGLDAAARVLADGRTYFEGETGNFYEIMFPEEKLVILGAGHVGRALAAAAPSLGFRVTVVDDRPELLVPERFPDGVSTLLAGFDQAIAGFSFDAATYAVVVTRGHLSDLECVRALLRRDYRYAGFMGSARKTRLVIEQVLKDGCDPGKVDTLWAPIGMDIGAETPEELANAILSEMIAVRRQSRTLPELRRASAARRT